MPTSSSFDEEKFIELYQQMMPKLIHFGYRWSGDKALAEDAVQEAFSKLWSKRAQINQDGSVEHLLYTMVRNNLINVYQRKLQEQRIITDIPSQDPVQSTEETEELLRRVGDYIEELPPRCKEVFLLSKKEGLTYTEIASELSITTKGVEKHISKALKMIRSHLKRAYYHFF